jgi:hypothetical protein
MKICRNIADRCAPRCRVLAIAFAVLQYCLSLSLRGSSRCIPSRRAATNFPNKACAGCFASRLELSTFMEGVLLSVMVAQ